MRPPLATMLFVPGSDEHKLDKIPSLASDAFIIDLEDAVAVSAKAAARGKVAAAMSWGNLYDKAAICGHPTSKSGIDMLVRSGWKLQGPVPRGVAPSVGMMWRSIRDFALTIVDGRHFVSIFGSHRSCRYSRSVTSLAAT